ncbi:MmcQ/YjbR family DNA-binding protein [Edwardsiella piscicida]|uniref:MmcQ/YjbR family DNA-binding protein n=1 Tax=Edwardsiella piscicida TaxID=1263550 RepID=UPI00084C24CE|nr:MmcQ/YjbR family DNA-binding protein [Edwardsiella piscicida]AOP43047.1 MmcQ/YjbR family DNA-binding protein [Edwardsiella piscicida]EKS7767016.1 MmcQ/YjbR family DNA-binding protein [Edwardsiella piscicida]EKS7792892.1 MmcQ/YjbR family DNA-binding protein [Edwardsiella piscicida]ELM3721983.1 MmcQ/YjbR family DNA-binding protein [Edwardsiella piscicida]ELM3727866.1 MmcQ/YjbR family DNA-binding protein [Edwardsiella piscicida]
MHDINDIFVQREVDAQRLSAYGFRQNEQCYIYSRDVADGQFVMTVTITRHGEISAAVVDRLTEEEYILHRIRSATGAFVGKIREEYENELINIAEKCFSLHPFKTEQAKEVIRFIKEKYHSELEFLWPRSPDNAIFRRSDNGKWYGAILRIKSAKLGGLDDDMVEVIDLKMAPDDISTLVDGRRYFPGYHMNKKYWVTLRLDGVVPLAEICRRIDNSFTLAATPAMAQRPKTVG